MLLRGTEGLALVGRVIIYEPSQSAHGGPAARANVWHDIEQPAGSNCRNAGGQGAQFCFRRGVCRRYPHTYIPETRRNAWLSALFRLPFGGKMLLRVVLFHPPLCATDVPSDVKCSSRRSQRHIAYPQRGKISPEGLALLEHLQVVVVRTRVGLTIRPVTDRARHGPSKQPGANIHTIR